MISHLLDSLLLDSRQANLVFIGPKFVIALPCHWVGPFTCWNLIDVTLACEDSRNLPCLNSCCQFWQLWCWHWNKINAILYLSEQNKSHVVDVGWKQRPFCWCKNKTKALLLMLKQNKSHGVKKVIRPIFSSFLHQKIRKNNCWQANPAKKTTRQ